MTEFLYIHFPFCIKKCIYCDFLSVPYDKSLASKYIDALCLELRMRKHSVSKLKAIYIGGGTPSLLPVERFKHLFECVRNNFCWSPSIEITVEANPGTISESNVNELVSLGVNRMSIGVQSFNDAELKTLGRVHSSEDAERAIHTVKNAGVRNLSLDLIYGIPGQTIETWKASASEAVAFSPCHISSYELTPEKNTPLYKSIETHQIKMPDEELVLEMYAHAIQYFTNNGFEHYEISNFALPEFRCIHNLNYWERGEYIGAGAGAHSFINDVRSRNTQDIHQYIEMLNMGLIPEVESTKIDKADAIKEFLFLGLRKTEGISLAQAEDFGLNIPDACTELIEEDYLRIKNKNLRLTKKGLPVSNSVIVSLFEKLEIR
ncbi:MAG: radical SAM family heme chaperone HemW [Nitrospirae bacterium]|nr:radical SAM family heme chaperone HemW [Nitrospirota bacterium]